jgi:hypothetical protein
MGLDQYAYSTAAVPGPVDFDIAGGEGDELHYWRKHPNLHGWMYKLYRSKGGKEDQSGFNCVCVELDVVDLAQLKADVEKNLLPSTAGFFFGQDSRDDEEKRDDLFFIQKAVAALAAGRKVYYTSWW